MTHQLEMPLAARDIERVIPDGQPNTSYQTAFVQYIYKPLQGVDEIRLLHIEPGLWDSNPRCAISHHRLSQCPRFEALSYVWGSEEKPCKIGCGEGGTLAVTRNCFAAIKRLRKLGSLVVWIDAVCINQENNLERGHQVKNMPDIYRAAAKVLVYLGEAEDHGEEAMETLHLYKWIQPSDPDTTIFLRKLMQRPWFQRLWVLQEVNKAQTVTVICGDRVIPWDPCFRLLVQWGPENFVRKELPYTLQIRGHDRKILESWDLLDLMGNTRFHDCTDPRDRIFALLSMSSEDSSRGIEPDYTATVEEVYTRAATCFLSRIGLDLLAMVDHGHQKISTLPSWVPDWSKRPTCTPITKLIDRDTISALKSYSIAQGSTLRIGGKYVEIIDDLGQIFEPDSSGWDKACIEDWGRLFAKWHPNADVASLDPVLHTSELYKYDSFDSIRTGFRCLTRSAAHTLLGIVKTERDYQFSRNVVFQPHNPNLLCSDEFLTHLSDPQFNRQTAIGLLPGSSSKFSEACIELHEMRFQNVSYPEMISGLKKTLIHEIRQWDFHENQLPYGTPYFPPIPAAAQRISELSDASTYPGFPDGVTPGSMPVELNLPRPPKRKRNSFSSREQHGMITERVAERIAARDSDEEGSSDEEKNQYRLRTSILSLIQMRFSLEFRHLFPYVKRLQGKIVQWAPYELFEKIMDENLNVLEKESHPAEPDLQERIEKLNSTSAQRIKECCRGRRLFIDEHVAGLVPASTQRGDLIYVPNGGSFPIVLREFDDQYALVGACFVVGDMDLQAGPYHDLTIV